MVRSTLFTVAASRSSGKKLKDILKISNFIHSGIDPLQENVGKDWKGRDLALVRTKVMLVTPVVGVADPEGVAGMEVLLEKEVPLKQLEHLLQDMTN